MNKKSKGENFDLVFCLFVCNRGDNIQYHSGLRSRELGQVIISPASTDGLTVLAHDLKSSSHLLGLQGLQQTLACSNSTYLVQREKNYNTHIHCGNRHHCPRVHQSGIEADNPNPHWQVHKRHVPVKTTYGIWIVVKSLKAVLE